MRSRHAVPLVLAFTFGLAACENSLGPDSVRSVDIAIDRTTLTEGETTGISVSASDIDGGSISGSEVTWISRDPTTVRVEDGALIGVAPGVTTIVADVRGARDSVRIRVSFADLDRGEIGVRLQGERGVRQATGGTTFMRRFLSLDDFPTAPAMTSIRTHLDGQGGAGAVDPLAADTLVWIMFGGGPTVGTRQLTPFVLDVIQGTLVLQGSEGAIVSITDPDQPLRTEIFTPVEDVDLEIDHVTFPEEPGTQGDGMLRGAVAFEAAGIVIERDPATHTVRIAGPASETTLRVYVEFETPLYESLIGSARVSVTRNGETATISTGGTAWLLDGGARYSLSGFSAPPEEGGLGDRITFDNRVEATGTGTVPVQHLDGDTFDPHAGEGGTWSFVRVFDNDPQGVFTEDDITGYGYSNGGEVVLTEYEPPTPHGFGLMRGTSTIAYELRDTDNALTGESFDATVEFVLPITPPCGLNPSCD